MVFLVLCYAFLALAVSEPFDEIVEAVNSKGVSWTAGVPTKFASSGDVKVYLGAYLPGSKNHKGLPKRNILVNNTLPASFDARTQWPHCSVISEVLDQSACGSCWAFASVESFQDRACILSGNNVHYSPEDTAFCDYTSQGCGGGQSSWGWFMQEGVVTGGSYEDIGKGDTCEPYQFAPCAHHVPGSKQYPKCPSEEYPSPKCGYLQGRSCSEKAYAKQYLSDKVKASDVYGVSGVSQIQSDLMNKGPMYVSFDVYEDFVTYKSGVYKHVTGKWLGGHAVELIGWGTEEGNDYWLIKNSWNDQWGDNGFFKIARGTGECGIEDDVSAGSVALPANNSVIV